MGQGINFNFPGPGTAMAFAVAAAAGGAAYVGVRVKDLWLDGRFWVSIALAILALVLARITVCIEKKFNPNYNVRALYLIKELHDLKGKQVITPNDFEKAKDNIIGQLDPQINQLKTRNVELESLINQLKGQK